MDGKKVSNILQEHVPPAAFDYCLGLWNVHHFKFKLRKTRVTKVGDFSCRTGQTPQITVNHDLHPYLFLMTYIHEVAHLVVHIQHGFKAEAHGEDWKNTFKQLFAPMLDPVVFPEPLLSVLRRHMANPKASSFSDTELTNLFRKENEKEANAVLLSDIPEGSIFRFHGRWFKKGKLRRTRVLCQEVKSKRQYLVPAEVPVQDAQLSLL